MFKCYYCEWESPVFTEIIHQLLEHHPQEQIRLKKNRKTISSKVSATKSKKNLSYFLKVSEILTWADTERFLGGVKVQSFDVYLFLFQKGNWISTSVPMKPIPSNENGPPSARQLSVI